jgi:hypothetical protein
MTFSRKFTEYILGIKSQINPSVAYILLIAIYCTQFKDKKMQKYPYASIGYCMFLKRTKCGHFA